MKCVTCGGERHGGLTTLCPCEKQQTAEDWRARAQAAEQVVDELHELLAKAIIASKPYLKRKKETQRSKWIKLNDAHKKVRYFYTNTK